MKRTALLAALVVFAAVLTGVSLPLTVLYTNDLHARLDRREALARLIVEERRQGNPVLLLDAGDAWHDFRDPIYSVWGDMSMVEWMNDVAYTAMALGNHDVYGGPARLRALLDAARFPVLCANWRPADVHHAPYGAVVVEAGDLRILLVGVTTAEFLPFRIYPAFLYRPPSMAVMEEVERHAGQFDAAFVIGHLSMEEARGIARAVPEISVVFTGHSHEETEDVIVEGTTIIVQAGAFGRSLGRLALDVDPVTRDVSVLSQELLRSGSSFVDRQAGVRRLLLVTASILLGVAVWLL